jgi:hypothetical protein
MRQRKWILAAVICSVPIVPLQGAVIQFDQFGNGLIDSTPISGYLSSYSDGTNTFSALTYNLPFTGQEGSLVLTDPNFSDLPMEILIFDGAGRVFFFAGNMPGSDAYVASPPALDYTSLVFVSDTGPEDSSTATFTPSPGDPGYDLSGPTYVIDNGVTPVSAPTPEPGTMVLIATGVLLPWLVRRAKR